MSRVCTCVWMCSKWCRCGGRGVYTCERLCVVRVCVCAGVCVCVCVSGPGSQPTSPTSFRWESNLESPTLPYRLLELTTDGAEEQMVNACARCLIATGGLLRSHYLLSQEISFSTDIAQ